MDKVFPSVLAADLSLLGQAAEDIKKWGADGIHFDVMDGHFVPNITYGPGVCGDMKKKTDLPVDVHLMVSEPAKWIEPFAKAGADYITFHAEAEPHMHRTLQLIHSFGIRGGVALNPCTGPDAVRYALPYCELVLLMTVNPGFGGQKFIPEVAEKIRALAELREKLGLSFEIEVDGGIGAETAEVCRQAGASVFVAGSAVFSAPDPAAAVRSIRSRG